MRFPSLGRPPEAATAAAYATALATVPGVDPRDVGYRNLPQRSGAVTGVVVLATADADEAAALWAAALRACLGVGPDDDARVQVYLNAETTTGARLVPEDLGLRPRPSLAAVRDLLRG